MPPVLSRAHVNVRCTNCQNTMPRVTDITPQGRRDRDLCTPCYREQRQATRTQARQSNPTGPRDENTDPLLLRIPRTKRCTKCDKLHREDRFRNPNGPEHDTCRLCRIATCGLCHEIFPSELFENPAGPTHTRCPRCRRREKCTKCKRIKRRAHFQRPSTPDNQNLPHLKTCDVCRRKKTRNTLRRRAEAEEAGLRWCTSCSRPVTGDECRDSNGRVYATCNGCRDSHRDARHQAQNNPEDLPEDEIVNNDNPDGVAVEERDEFDEIFGNGEEMSGIELPEDSPLSREEAECINRFIQAEARLQREVCPTCNEIDWDMKMRDGVCYRCRDDKGEPVLKFSAANKVSPAPVIPDTLKGLTALEENMISLALPMVKVTYTKGRQLSYQEHIVNIPQDIANMAQHLPRTPEDCETIIIRKSDVDMSRYVDFVVRREKVRNALQYKMQHDPAYFHLRDDPVTQQRIDDLPIHASMADCVPTIAPTPVDRSDEESDAPAGPLDAAVDETEDLHDGEISNNGILNLGQPEQREVDQIRDNTSRLLDPDPPTTTVRYSQRHHIIAAPVHGDPMGEWTPGYIPKCFPTLFPDGEGDFYQPRLRKITLGEYFDHLMRYQDDRFAQHKKFPWWAFNTLQRQRARTQSKIFVKQSHDAEGLTAAEIRELLSDGDTTLANRMIRYGAQLRGTRSFWLSRRAELTDAIHVLGSPHVFITLSAADLQWPGLHDNMPAHHFQPPAPEHDEKARVRQRMSALNTNPHIAASYLDKRVQLYMKLVLKPLLKVKHYWYRYEWQQRGSGHIHGFLWLEDAPNLDDIDWEHAKKKDAIISDEQQTKINEFVAYWERLITAWDPCGPEPEPGPNRFSRNPTNIRPETLYHTNAELHDLISRVERHSRCLPGYCQVLRKVPGLEERQVFCRFDFPFERRNDAGWGTDSRGRPRFEPRRNDPLMNQHNRTLIMGWRANIDFRPVLSSDSALQYIAKYATKAESKAPTFDELLKSVTAAADDDLSARIVCQKMLNKMLGEREYSAQETAHLLLGIPLVCSTFSYQSLNLSKDGALREVIHPENGSPNDLDLPPDGDDSDSRPLTGDSWIQRYEKRPEFMEELSLQELHQKYRWRGKKWTNRAQDACVIVCVYPRISPNPEGPDYESYCQIKAILHHPFRAPMDLLKANDGMDRSWQEVYADCTVHHNHHPRDTLRDWKKERNPVDEEEDDDEDVNADITRFEEEDWQIYERIMPRHEIPEYENTDLGRRPVDNAWNLEETWARWANVERMASYVADQRAESGYNPIMDDDSPPVNVNTLAPEQRVVFDQYVAAFQDIVDGKDIEQQLMNVDGTAGCGKTYLIRAISQTLRRMATENGLDDPIRVLAPSGVAALNILGRTIHSALRIPVTGSSFIPLSGSRLATLQQQWKGVHFIIIDEKSMVGQRLFAKLESRLRQLKPSDNLFGGFHLSLIGDFAQLPPVKDRALFSSPARQDTEAGKLSRDGHSLYLKINRSHKLTVVHRQSSSSPAQIEFRELLRHASLGGISQQEWELLVTRTKDRLPGSDRDQFGDAVCLFTTSADVEATNLNHLAALDTPCARIEAQHEGGAAGKSLSAEDAGGLEPVIVLSRGAKVMVTRNIWQDKALVNGTLGTVEDIIWLPGSNTKEDLPIAVLVSCPTYTGPTLWRTDPRPNFPNGIPIIPIAAVKSTVENDGIYLSRTQVPLRLAWSITVHKSQGLTLPRIQVGLGKTEFCVGLTFVALSRVKELKDIMLVEAVDYSRVQKLGGVVLTERLEDFARRYPLHR